MARIASILLLAVVISACTASGYKSLFETFKARYNRKYSSSLEEGKRFDNFVRNMKTAAKLNETNPLAHFGMNEFSDASAEEFKSRHNADRIYAKLAEKMGKAPTALFSEEEVKAAVPQVDWRTKGAVTAVKNQGNCGGCWSFSTTGGVEGQWFLAGNNLTSLSEQLFVSCDPVDQGCNGGTMEDAIKWVVSTHDGVLVTEASYPYASGSGVTPPCVKGQGSFGAKVTGYELLPHNEDQMATWVAANGPLSIAVAATPWTTYSGGIMTNCPAKQVDHGVLIVGFDNSHKPPYWIVKNSWGPSWGENGYIRLEKGTNQCSITYQPATSKIAPGPYPPPGPSGDPVVLMKSCQDATCSGSCSTKKIPMNKCTSIDNGKSYIKISKCTSMNIKITKYPGVFGCTRSGTVMDTMPNVCNYDEVSGGFNSYQCT